MRLGFGALLLPAAVTAMAVGAPASAHSRLASASLLRVSDGASAPLTESWGAGERAAVFLFRSFG